MYLERVEPESVGTVYKLLQKHALACGIPFETYSLDAFRPLFEASFYFWWRDRDEVYALVNIGALEPQSRKAEFGVISLVRRKGHAAAACYAVLSFGFETLNLHRMYAIVNSDNQASVNLCNKHGMVLEGVIRGGRFKRGKYVDQIVFGVLESEKEIWAPSSEEKVNATDSDRRGDGGGGHPEGTGAEKGRAAATSGGEKAASADVAAGRAAELP